MKALGKRQQLTLIFTLQWRHSSCYNGSSCHDYVDFSLCFEDTAMLYGALLLCWVVAGLMFLFGRNNYQLSLPFSLIHATKLVSQPFFLLCCHCLSPCLSRCC